MAEANEIHPADSARTDRPTSYKEMMTLLREIVSPSKQFQLQIIGKSVKGRDIPALFYSPGGGIPQGTRQRPLVLVYCQQHGNEPAGKEAALLLAQELASEKGGRKYDFDLIIVPLVNPDGSETASRRNANDVDLNRDYIMLSQPETQALYDLFLDYLPEVALDVHEYNAVVKEWVDYGIIKDADIMFDGVTNLNISEEIMSFSFDTIMPALGEILEGEGWRFNRYIIGTPDEGDIIRHSTTEVNDARHSMGIYNTFSFIIEGKKYTGSLSYLNRRVEIQLSALRAFLDVINRNSQEIWEITQQARQDILAGVQPEDDMIHLQFQRLAAESAEGLEYPVFDLYAWRPEMRTFPNYSPGLQPRVSVRRPYAYIIPADVDGLFELLRKRRIQMYRLAGKSDLSLEIYRILQVSPEDADGISQTEVRVRRLKEVRRIEGGAVVIYLNQPGGRLIPLLLEPQSPNRIIPLSGGIQGGSSAQTRMVEYPIYRLAEDIEIGLIPYEKITHSK